MTEHVAGLLEWGLGCLIVGLVIAIAFQEADSPRARESRGQRQPPSLAIKVFLGVLAAAYAVLVRIWPGFLFLLPVLAGGLVTFAIREHARRRRSVARFWVLYAAALAASVVALAANHHRLAALRIDRWRREEADKRTAEALQGLRRGNWKADPALGVDEAVRGSVRMWLAVAPVVEVDAAWERELGDRAERSVPVSITLLNDTFSPAREGSETAPVPLRWKLSLEDGQGRLVRAWDLDESGRPPMEPAERRDYRVAWDGRDADGKLAGEGNYRWTLETAFAEGALSCTVPSRISDGGAVNVVKESPEQQMEQMLRDGRQLQGMIDATMRLENQTRWAGSLPRP